MLNDLLGAFGIIAIYAFGVAVLVLIMFKIFKKY